MLLTCNLQSRAGILPCRVIQRHLYRVAVPGRHSSALPRYVGLLGCGWFWKWDDHFGADSRAAILGLAVAASNPSIVGPWPIARVTSVLLTISDAEHYADSELVAESYDEFDPERDTDAVSNAQF